MVLHKLMFVFDATEIWSIDCSENEDQSSKIVFWAK